jgi:hypothetical protein
MNTLLTFHDTIGWNIEPADGFADNPHPCAHAYSVLELSTPRNTTVPPPPSTNCVPDTRIPLSPPPPELAVTALVFADIADPDPPALLAVTTTSIVSPTSDACSV